MAAFVPPRIEVVADRRAVHAVLFGEDAEFNEFAGPNCSADALYPSFNSAMPQFYSTRLGRWPRC